MAEKLNQPEQLDFKNGYDMCRQIAEQWLEGHGSSMDDYMKKVHPNPLFLSVLKGDTLFEMLFDSEGAVISAEVKDEQGAVVGYPKVHFEIDDDNKSFDTIEWGIPKDYPGSDKFNLPQSPQELYEIFIAEPAAVAQDS